MISRIIQLYRNSFQGLSRAVWLLAFVMFINRMGTMVIPFLTIYLTTQLGFTLGQAGWAMTCFGLGSVLGSWLGGRLTDKCGPQPVQFWALFLGGLLFICLQWLRTPWAIYSMIFIVSMVADGFRPASMAAVGAYSKPENRTRSFSLLRLAINLGWSAGPAIGGWLAAHAGYEWLFWADGLTCIAAAIVLKLLLSPVRMPSHEEQKEEGAPGGRSPYKDKHYLFFLLLTIIGAVVFMQFFSTLPVFYKQSLHLDEQVIGLIMAYNGLLVFVFEMPMVYMAERRFRQIHCIMAGSLLYGLSYIVLNISAWPLGIALLGMTALSFGEILGMPFTNTYAISRASSASRGQYMGLFTMAFSSAHVIAPVMGMQIADRLGFEVLWYLLGVLSVVVIAGLWYLDKKQGWV